MTLVCPVCGSRQLRRSIATPRLVVYRCPTCSHRTAEHHGTSAAGVDYHAQYDQGEFLVSLEATRRRQSGVIIDLIRRHLPEADRLLDMGAGRGWFLEACRDAGMHELAGADTSELAVRSLTERHFAALPLVPSSGVGMLRDLPFRPKVLTLLDVIEHFQPEALRATLGGMVQELLPELRLVVIKVPNADGLLYSLAAMLARAGMVTAIEQLYQVGTDPPHFSYFTPRSMRRLLPATGLTLVDMVGDPDFEPGSFRDRARALRKLPTSAAGALGRATIAVGTVTSSLDSLILLAKPLAASDAEPPPIGPVSPHLIPHLDHSLSSGSLVRDVVVPYIWFLPRRPW